MIHSSVVTDRGLVLSEGKLKDKYNMELMIGEGKLKDKELQDNTALYRDRQTDFEQQET